MERVRAKAEELADGVDRQFTGPYEGGGREASLADIPESLQRVFGLGEHAPVSTPESREADRRFHERGHDEASITAALAPLSRRGQVPWDDDPEVLDEGGDYLDRLDTAVDGVNASLEQARKMIEDAGMKVTEVTEADESVDAQITVESPGEGELGLQLSVYGGYSVSEWFQAKGELHPRGEFDRLDEAVAAMAKLARGETS